MLSKSLSQCLHIILRKSSSYAVLPFTLKWFGFNGGSGRKAIASLFYKVSAFCIVADCVTSDASVRKQKQLQLSEPVDLNSLSLIQRAATVTVDAATQLLTQTTAAAIERSEMYRNAMEQMIQLMDESLKQGNNSVLQEQIQDAMIPIRNDINSTREELLDLERFMEYVIKVATDAADTAYIAGAEFASTVMCERLDSALQLWRAESLKTKKVEEMYLKINQKFIINYTELKPNNGMTQV